MLVYGLCVCMQLWCESSRASEVETLLGPLHEPAHRGGRHKSSPPQVSLKWRLYTISHKQHTHVVRRGFSHHTVVHRSPFFCAEWVCSHITRFLTGSGSVHHCICNAQYSCSHLSSHGNTPSLPITIDIGYFIDNVKCQHLINTLFQQDLCSGNYDMVKGWGRWWLVVANE